MPDAYRLLIDCGLLPDIDSLAVQFLTILIEDDTSYLYLKGYLGSTGQDS